MLGEPLRLVAVVASLACLRKVATIARAAQAGASHRYHIPHSNRRNQKRELNDRPEPSLRRFSDDDEKLHCAGTYRADLGLNRRYRPIRLSGNGLGGWKRHPMIARVGQCAPYPKALAR